MMLCSLYLLMYLSTFKIAKGIPDFKILLGEGRTCKFEATSLHLHSYLRVFTLQWSASLNCEKLLEESLGFT